MSSLSGYYCDRIVKFWYTYRDGLECFSVILEKKRCKQFYQLLDEIISELNKLPSVNDEVNNDLAQIALTNEESSPENNEE